MPETYDVAVIGAGVSGLVAAHLLSGDHEVVVYEANDYAGGHTCTVDVPTAAGPIFAVSSARQRVSHPPAHYAASSSSSPPSSRRRSFSGCQ